MQEIQIELNKEEINAIMSLLDIANRSEGLKVAEAIIHFKKKIDSSLEEEVSHSVVELWKSSAPHNKALLNKNATIGGVSSGVGMDLENWNGTTYNLRYFTLVVWGEPIMEQ